VEQSPATIVITDLDGSIIYVNPQFCKTTGYTVDEVLGKNPRILKSGHTGSEEYGTLWETIKEGGEWRGEFHNRKKNGELYWESSSISPIIDNGGVITHYLAVKEDITARKQMETALQRRNDELIFINRVSHAMVSHLDIEQILDVMLEELRSFWNVSAGMIWMIEDGSGDLVCSRATEPYQEKAIDWRLPAERSLLGWVQRENKGLLVDDAPQDPRFYAIDQDGLPVRALMAVPLQSSSATIGILDFVDEQVGRFTETELNLVQSLAATAVNAIENARLHQNLQTQFRTLKETQTRLVQSEKLAAIGELISGIAHELNNPLASIILYAQLMEARGVEEKVRRDLKQIVTQSHRANSVVRGLLDFARQRPSARTPTQVNDVLKSTVDLLAYELRTHNINVETNFSTAVPVTLADGHQLQQVFVNLINNALQAMDSNGKGGKLTLTTKCTGPHLVEPATEKTILIIIQDDGPGITKESASRVFDPFFTTKAEGKGTGLGLAVCHGIITDHQGDIWMESEPGRGTTFFIELPIRALAKAVVVDVVEETAVSPDAKNAHEKRILVVDDEASILMIVMRVLQRKGFVVDGVENGAAALEQLQQQSYDLIISDLRMPAMSGQTFYRQAIAKYPEYNGRFVFTTGDAINSDLRAFLEEANTPALEKPFEMAELIDIAMQMVA
jgi:two-component system NtrC family sensor kinase